MLATLAERSLADLIDDPDSLRLAIERTERESSMLRAMLRVSLSRNHTPGQLRRLREALQEGEGHATQA